MTTPTTRTITATRSTGTGDVTVSVDVDFDIPQKGDTIDLYGHEHVLTQDAELGIDFTFNEATRKYEGTPLRTRDGLDNLVFYFDDYSWREGEGFTKGH